MIIFDIETRPLDRETVLAMSPEFKSKQPPGEFNESTVSVGNLKDPVKIKAKIDIARDKHLKAVENFESDNTAAKEKHESDAMDKAALNPLTGQVLAIGYKSVKGVVLQVTNVKGPTEADLLNSFWKMYQKSCGPLRKMVGHNIFGFDLPFLVRRSWLLDVSVPSTVLERGRYWNDRVFIDTMKLWQCGSFGEWIKLDTLSKAFGGDGKPDGVDGSMFSDLIKGTEEQKQQAIEYLKNDLEMTWKVAVSLGVM